MSKDILVIITETAVLATPEVLNTVTKTVRIITITRVAVPATREMLGIARSPVGLMLTTLATVVPEIVPPVNAVPVTMLVTEALMMGMATILERQLSRMM